MPRAPKHAPLAGSERPRPTTVACTPGRRSSLRGRDRERSIMGRAALRPRHARHDLGLR